MGKQVGNYVQRKPAKASSSTVFRNVLSGMELKSGITFIVIPNRCELNLDFWNYSVTWST